MIFVYIILGLLGLVVILLCIALINTIRIKDRTLNVSARKVDPKKTKEYAKEFSTLIQIKTLSYQEELSNTEPFEELHKQMEILFPHVYKTVEKTIFKSKSFIFKWKGLSSELPLVLMAHQDVVPAEEEGWDFPPYSGTITDGNIQGRGTLDTKSTLYAFFKAIDELIKEGYTPKHDIYISSSTDEEISGNGAQQSVKYLQEQGITPYFVLDEGGAIVSGSLPSMQKPVALIGVLEKGYANIKFTAKSKGGHSSYPPKNSPIARLSAFVNQIETNFPLKTKMIPEVADIFKKAAPAMKGIYRFLFGNMWLFKPVLTYILPKTNPFGRALLSTTIAFTMQKGSDAENVIPSEAYVIANLRVHPIQDIDQSFKVLQEIANEYNIKAEILEARPASSISSTSNQAYKYLNDIIQTNYPDVLVTPYVMLGGTDCRFFSQLTESAFRFSPIRMDNSELKKIHGTNESIPSKHITEAVRFYKELISNHK